MARDITIQGTEAVRAELEKLRRKLQMGMATAVDRGAKAAAETVMRNTQPFGNSAAAQRKGKGAIRRDLLGMFRVVASGGRRVIEDVASARRWHDQHWTPGKPVSLAKKASITQAAFVQLLEQLHARVGAAKAGWADAVSRAGGRVPAWVADKSSGSARRSAGFGGVKWRVRGGAKHLSEGRVLGERGLRRALRSVDRVLRNQLLRELRRRP